MRPHSLGVLVRRRTHLIPTMLVCAALFQWGCVAPGKLTLTPTNLNFGDVPLGSSSSQKVTISNSGTTQMTITKAVVSGKGFNIKEPSLPMTLAAGQSATFTTIFRPYALGSSSGSVSITRRQLTPAPLPNGSEPVAENVTTNVESVMLAGAGVPVTPSITTQPASQTVTAGQAATFSVLASGGGPLSYQWMKNGASISGATSSTYSTPATSAADSGSQFTVAVSNSAGNIISSAAVLTVASAGQLTASTTNLSYGNVKVGSSNMLPVTLTNSGGSNVSISNVTLSGAGLSASGVSSGLILAAGKSTAMNVMFTPSAAANLSGNVTVTSNATNSTLVISVLGNAVQPTSHSVTLNLASSSPNGVGYNVYRSSASNGPFTKLNPQPFAPPIYTDSTVLTHLTYYYVATSVDSAGNETPYSNQVSATIPAP
jgi:hypothetical protein